MNIIFDEIKQFIVKEIIDKHQNISKFDYEYWNLEKNKKYIIVYFDAPNYDNPNKTLVAFEFAGYFSEIYEFDPVIGGWDYMYSNPEGYVFCNPSNTDKHTPTGEEHCSRTSGELFHKFYELEYNFESNNLKQIYQNLIYYFQLNSNNNFNSIKYKTCSLISSDIIYDNKYENLINFW